MKELVIIQNELIAPKNQRNSFGNYNYRSCEDILVGLKPHLIKHNCFLTVNDEVELIGDRYYIKATATIYNSEGANVSVSAMAREPLTKKGMDEAQLTGATSSYARKYALNGLFAIDDTKDADSRKPEDNCSMQAAQEELMRQESITEYKKNIGQVMSACTKAGVNNIELKNSVKKHLGVEKVFDCNDLKKLKDFLLHMNNKLSEVKK